MTRPHIEPTRLRTVFGHFATGVAIVTTAREDGQAFGMTINSFASLSLDPPLILWSIARSSDNHELFTCAREFAVHVLNADQAPLTRQFATKGEERFRGVEFERSPAQTPLLSDYHARMLCQTEHCYDGGDHTIIIGRVLDLHEKAGEPLVFYRGRLNCLQDLGERTKVEG